MKRLLALWIIGLLVLVGCGGGSSSSGDADLSGNTNNPSLVGKWHISTLDGEDVSGFTDEVTFDATTYSYVDGFCTEGGTYETEGSILNGTVTFAQGDCDAEVGGTFSFSFAVNETTLTIIDDGEVVVWNNAPIGDDTGGGDETGTGDEAGGGGDAGAGDDTGTADDNNPPPAVALDVAGDWEITQSEVVYGWTETSSGDVAQDGSVITFTNPQYPQFPRVGDLEGLHLSASGPGEEGTEVWEIDFSADGTSFTGTWYETEGNEHGTIEGVKELLNPSLLEGVWSLENSFGFYGPMVLSIEDDTISGTYKELSREANHFGDLASLNGNINGDLIQLTLTFTDGFSANLNGLVDDTTISGTISNGGTFLGSKVDTKIFGTWHLDALNGQSEDNETLTFSEETWGKSSGDCYIYGTWTIYDGNILALTETTYGCPNAQAEDIVSLPFLFSGGQLIVNDERGQAVYLK